MIAVSAVCAGIFASVRAGRCAEQARAVAGLGERLIPELTEAYAELSRDFESMHDDEWQGRPDEYREFIENYKKRIAIYSDMEEELMEVEPDFEPLERAVGLLGKMVSAHRSLDMSEKHCADSVMYSKGAAPEMACFEGAPELILKDYNKSAAGYGSLMGKVKSGGWLAKALMKSREEKSRRKSDGRPNVVIILIDALRADRIGSGAVGTMPFLEVLAREGVVYSDAVSPSSTTYTSVASLFTGLDPYENNSVGSRMWASEKSLVQGFREIGYLTVGFSANSLISEENGFGRGFDYFCGRYWSPAPIVYNDIISHIRYEGGLRQPFFMYLHLIDPHDPYFSPDTFEKLSVEGRPEGYIADPNVIRDDYISRGIYAASAMPAGNIEYLEDLYNEEAAYVDKWINRFFSRMESMGLIRNTIFVITADHGESFLEHGDVKHSRQLYREMVNVPLVVSGELPSGVAGGSVVSDPHSTMEILPSLLKVAGGEVKGAAALRTGLFTVADSEAPVISVTKGLSLDMKRTGVELMSIRQAGYKLIMEIDSGEYRFYDLAADPGEKNDLSDEMQGPAAELAGRAVAVRKISQEAGRYSEGRESPGIRKQLKTLGYIK